MLLSLYIIFAWISTFLGLVNYRFGLWLMLLVTLLGDPVRKLTPDNPVFISVCFVPIFCVVYLRFFFMSRSSGAKRIFYYYPQLKVGTLFYLFCVAFAFLNAFIRNASALPLILYSLAQYLGIIVAAQAGYYFLRRSEDLISSVKFFIFTELIFLVTVVPHFMGLQSQWPVLKTMNFEGAYLQFHSGQPLEMLNGVFRSPEIMGWNAMMVVIGCIFLIARRRLNLFGTLFFSSTAVFGVFCILASGRRKFFLAVFIFILIFLFLIMKKNVKRMLKVLLALLVLFGIGWRYLESQEKLELYLRSAKSAYAATEERLTKNTIGSINWAIQRDGIFGAGLGASTQGGGHFREHISEGAGIEAGPGKIFSELGVQGVLALFVLILSYLGSIFRVIGRRRFAGNDFVSAAFLVALAATHLVSFGASHQIYGDPFVAIMTGMTFGMVLAMLRILTLKPQL